MVMVVPLKCAAPVARAEHPVDIMLFMGMSMVKVMSSPDMVPEREPGVRPAIPAKLIEPVTVDPFCVRGHVIAPMLDWPMTVPAPAEVLESDAAPAQVPVTDN